MPPKRKSTRSSAVVAPGAEPELSEEDEEEDYNQLTVVHLRAELEKRQLDTKGNKAALVQRLQDSQDGAALARSAKKAKAEPKSKTQKADKNDGVASSSKITPKVHKIDPRVADPNAYSKVHEDYSFMLNQTFIQQNNNKFYVGQLLQFVNGKFNVFTKWGRVGEPGQVQYSGPLELEEAIAYFGKKFLDKTGNKWENRNHFQAKSGKYTLIETEDEEEQATVSIDNSTIVVGDLSAKSALDLSTRKLVDLIFDNDMFRDAMKGMNLDTKKMPLGKLSKAQIAKGFQVLEQLEAELKTKSPNKPDLCTFSNEFYTLIPHDFARNRPPIIDNLIDVQAKFDMLNNLSDIEEAQDMQKSKNADKSALHPCDIRYDLLKCKLTLIDKASPEFQVIDKYFASTRGNGSWNAIKSLRNVWIVDRHLEDERFKVHDELSHRKLLWHGTNVAVVAAILKSGLRIMPHSGGRVGRGIYFASENSKSAGYTRPAKQIGLMFLNEVALGREREIDRDDSSLKAPPAGYDSVVARGQREPDPQADTEITLGRRKVIVPQGPPTPVQRFSTSNFDQSEYLIYRESQVRIRYLLAFDWSH